MNTETMSRMCMVARAHKKKGLRRWLRHNPHAAMRTVVCYQKKIMVMV